MWMDEWMDGYVDEDGRYGQMDVEDAWMCGWMNADGHICRWISMDGSVNVVG